MVGSRQKIFPWLFAGVVIGCLGALAWDRLQPWPLPEKKPSASVTATNTFTTVALQPPVTIQFDSAFQAMLHRWQRAGLDENLLIDVVASEFDHQQEFFDRENRRTLILPPFAARGMLRLNHGQHKREDAIIALLGQNAFDRWKKPQLMKQLVLDSVPLTADESNDLYQICQKKMREQSEDSWMSNWQTFGHEHRQALRKLLGEKRYYQFAIANEWNHNYGGLNFDNQMSNEQRIECFKQYEQALDAPVANPAPLFNDQQATALDIHAIQERYTNWSGSTLSDSNGQAAVAALAKLTKEQSAAIFTQANRAISSP